MNTQKSLLIIFIIGGDEIEIEANLHEPLHAARNAALAKSRETGRKDPNEWDIKDEEKNLLDPERKLESFNFPPKVRLYLVPRVSAGGN